MIWGVGPALETSRANIVDDSAATLRRVERDLHDGAQARLVSVAMNLGEVKERLDSEAGNALDDRSRSLIESAHLSAKEAITELRDVVRGMHPPILDTGLTEALETLASRSAVPVELHIELPNLPGVAVESIAYFCVAELLVNVAKHSGARRASVDIVEQSHNIRIQVTDNGMGGASVSSGSGLRGLESRISAVDGVLAVNSPRGGPTIVTIDLPIREQR